MGWRWWGFLLWVGAFSGAHLRPVVRSGLLVGVVATAVYDVSRVAVVGLLDLPMRPFAAWPLFEAALIGEAAPAAARTISGFGFHLVMPLVGHVVYGSVLGAGRAGAGTTQRCRMTLGDLWQAKVGPPRARAGRDGCDRRRGGG